MLEEKENNEENTRLQDSKDSDKTLFSPELTDVKEIKAAEADVAVEWNVGDVILDLYEVKKVYSGGGMGLVYKVLHMGWNTELAVKSPRKDYFKTEEQKNIFIKECETWIELGLHPHVVSCYYVRNLGNIPRVFAEFVKGGNLKEWIRSKKLYEGGPDKALERILDIAIQMAWGIQYAHEKGVIHQDIKPANLLLTPDGIAKITDFGLGVTEVYCSPEQANKEKLTIKTDIWSWALTILEMFTGERTWQTGLAAPEVLKNYAELGAENTSIPNMPQTMRDLLKSCFQREPEYRPNDMHEISSRLEEIYKQTTGDDYPRINPKLAELTADNLNNRAVSFLDLVNIPLAKESLTLAQTKDLNHIESTYNLALLQWRLAEIDDNEVLRRLLKLPKTPDNNRRQILDAQSYIERERFNLKHLPSKLTSPAIHIHKFGKIDEHSWIGLRDTLKNELNYTYNIDISPNGKLVLVGGDSNSLYIWNTVERNCLTIEGVKLDGPIDAVTAIALTEDCKYGLSGTKSANLQLWDIENRIKLAERKVRSWITSVDIDNTAKFMLCGCRNSRMYLWNIDDSNNLKEYFTHPEDQSKLIYIVNDVFLDVSNQRAFSASADGRIKSWNLQSGLCEQTILASELGISCITFDPNSQLLLSGGYDNVVRLWDIKEGRCLREFKGHTNCVTSLDISSYKNIVISASSDHTLKIWNLSTGRCLRTLHDHDATSRQPKMAIRLSQDGDLAVSAGYDESIRIWDINISQRYMAPYLICEPKSYYRIIDEHTALDKNLKVIDELINKNRNIEAFKKLIEVWKSIKFQGNNILYTYYKRLYSKGKTGLFIEAIAASTQAHDRRCESINLTADGSIALTVGRGEKSICQWDMNNIKLIRKACWGGSNTYNTSAISNSGKHAILGSPDESIWSFDLSNGEARHFLDDRLTSYIYQRQPLRTIIVDWEQNLIVSIGTFLTVWDLKTETPIYHIDPPNVGQYFISAVISHDESTIVSGDSWFGLYQYLIKTGELTRQIKSESRKLVAVATYSNGQIALAGTEEGPIEVIDIIKGKTVNVLKGHCAYISGLEVNEYANIIISASLDHTIRIWDIKSLNCLATLDAGNPITCMAIISDASVIISGQEDGTIIQWNLIWDLKF